MTRGSVFIRKCVAPAEGVLDRLTPLAHGFWILVEPPLHGLKHMLVLPAGDPALFARPAVTTPPGELMYIEISFFGFSASRNSNSAIITEALARQKN